MVRGFWYNAGMAGDYVKKTIDTYNLAASHYADKVRRYAPLKELEKFTNLVRAGGKILDAGCGPGRDCAYFVSKGFKVVGVDLSEKLLAIAEKEAPSVRFYPQDLRNLNFPERSFDGIWACASLLHLKKTEVPTVLSKFFTLLRPGGVLFILLKEGEGEGVNNGATLQGFPRFFSFFRETELSSLLQNAGFEVEEMTTWDQKDRWSERTSEVWISSFSKKKL